MTLQKAVLKFRVSSAVSIHAVAAGVGENRRYVPGENERVTYLTDLATALAALGERDLLGLRAAIDGSPNFVPGLLAWLEHAIGWEIDRRAGLVYPQLDAHAAIPDGEIDRSVVALAVLAACFRDHGRTDSVPVADFPEFTAEVLRTEFRITTLCTSITPKNVRMRVRHIAERRRPCSG